MKSVFFLFTFFLSIQIYAGHGDQGSNCGGCKSTYDLKELDGDIEHLSSELVRTLGNIRLLEGKNTTAQVRSDLVLVAAIALNDAKKGWNDYRAKLKSLVRVKVENDLAAAAISQGVSTDRILSGALGAQMFLDYVDAIKLENNTKESLLVNNLYYETLGEMLREKSNLTSKSLFGAENTQREVQFQNKLDLIPKMIGTVE
jgi:hypothetical protein